MHPLTRNDPHPLTHALSQIHWTRQSFDATVTPQDLVDSYMGVCVCMEPVFCVCMEAVCLHIDVYTCMDVCACQ